MGLTQAAKSALLSDREYQIAHLAARALSNKEIAQHLGVAEGTVKFHLHNILRKLGIKSRSELILRGAFRQVGR